MKKFGFTMAEVLITLTIIGVVAALVLPTFTSNMQKQKIGPKLAKAVAVFEQAAQSVLDDTQSDSISGAMALCSNDATELNVLADNDCFLYNLGHHIKGEVSTDNDFILGTDGVAYILDADGFAEEPTLFPEGDASMFAHENQIMANLTININAAGGGNTEGFDIFHFYVMDDGSLIPWGSTRDVEDNRWTTQCARPAAGGRPATPEDARYCAGHVLENNLKVEYR